MVTRVAIITHEGGALPLEETLLDMMAQLFLSLNTSLETDILVNNFDENEEKDHEQLKLVDQPNYKKILVDHTEYIKNRDAELIIMLGHGLKRDTVKYLPAGILFTCPRSKAGIGHSSLTVWAKYTGRVYEQTMLHQVIRRSKIVIMLACYGNEIIEDYLQYLSDTKHNTHDAYPFYPDILMCHGRVDNVSVHIFTVLFINLLDSQVDTLPVRDLHGDVRTVILRIMQIVQLFGSDHNAFWDFLQEVECITDEKKVKNNQQLKFTSKRQPGDYYRIYGHTCPYKLLYPVQVQVLTDFKRLTLMTRGENGMPEYHTSDSVDPIVLTNESTGITHVDAALKRRKRVNEHIKRHPHVPVPSHFVAPSQPDSLERLLLQLKLTST